MAKKILIVEDEQAISKVLELKLKNFGYKTRIICCGDEALDVFKKEKFDLILLDLVMPNKDGFEVLKELKKLKSKVPVIILSNLSQEEDKRKAAKLGVKNFFVKSNTPLTMIVKEVEKILK